MIPDIRRCERRDCALQVRRVSDPLALLLRTSRSVLVPRACAHRANAAPRAISRRRARVKTRFRARAPIRPIARRSPGVSTAARAGPPNRPSTAAVPETTFAVLVRLCAFMRSPSSRALCLLHH